MRKSPLEKQYVKCENEATMSSRLNIELLVYFINSLVGSTTEPFKLPIMHSP